jgi:hypothetical protein
MKFKLAGQYSVSHFAAAIVRLIDDLQRNGVDEIRHVNLYMQLYSKGRLVQILDEDGEILDALEYDSASGRSIEALDHIFKSRAR